MPHSEVAIKDELVAPTVVLGVLLEAPRKALHLGLGQSHAVPGERYASQGVQLGKKNLAVESHKNVRYFRVIPHHRERIVRNVEQRVITRVHKQQVPAGHCDHFVAFRFGKLNECSSAAPLIDSILLLLNE